MILQNVTDIAIPQGNVVKIHETVGGRILWQKKKKVLSAHWELSEYDAGTNPAGATIGHWLDTGSELIQTCNQDNDDPYNYYRYYNPIDNTFSTMHKMKLPDSDEENDTYPIVIDWAIDPVTKVWCSTTANSSKYDYYCSVFNDDTFRDLSTSVSRCCWSEPLNRFCLTGVKKSFLMDTEGNIYEKDDSSSPGKVLPTSSSLFVLCAGNGISKFIAYEHALLGNNRADAIAISPNGYDWTYIEKISDELPDSSSNNERGLGVTWVPSLNAYVAIVGNSSGYYVFKSLDGIEWAKLSTIPVNENEFPSKAYERYIFGEYSPEKNIVAFVISMAAYISEDCVHWIEVSLLDTGISTSRYSENHRKNFIWSNSLNAFLYGTPPGKFRKLIID